MCAKEENMWTAAVGYLNLDAHELATSLLEKHG